MELANQAAWLEEDVKTIKFKSGMEGKLPLERIKSYSPTLWVSKDGTVSGDDKTLAKVLNSRKIRGANIFVYKATVERVIHPGTSEHPGYFQLSEVHFVFTDLI